MAEDEPWSVELFALGALEQPDWVRLRERLEPYRLVVDENVPIDGIAIRIQVMAHDSDDALRKARELVSGALPSFIDVPADAYSALPVWLREGKSRPT
jgi:hypothetical protein